MYNPINEVKASLEALEYHVDNYQKVESELLAKISQLWYFIIATVVFTLIGIISVLTWTTT